MNRRTLLRLFPAAAVAVVPTVMSAKPLKVSELIQRVDAVDDAHKLETLAKLYAAELVRVMNQIDPSRKYRFAFQPSNGFVLVCGDPREEA